MTDIWRKDLQEERSVLAHNPRTFRTKSAEFIALDPRWDRTSWKLEFTTEESHLSHGSQKADRQEGAGEKVPLKDTLLLATFFHQFPSPTIFHSNHKTRINLQMNPLISPGSWWDSHLLITGSTSWESGFQNMSLWETDSSYPNHIDNSSSHSVSVCWMNKIEHLSFLFVTLFSDNNSTQNNVEQQKRLEDLKNEPYKCSET